MKNPVRVSFICSSNVFIKSFEYAFQNQIHLTYRRLNDSAKMTRCKVIGEEEQILIFIDFLYKACEDKVQLLDIWNSFRYKRYEEEEEDEV